ncbi:MAG: HAD family hydrolase [Faecalibacillus sp.]
MLKVKAVIFDMDGLMIDTEPVGNMICIQAHQKFGYMITQDMLFDLIGRNAQSAKEYYISVFGENYPTELIREEANRLREDYYSTHCIEVKPGLYELLAYLKSQGILMAVASSTKSDRVLENLKEIHVENDFDCIIGGDKIIHGKPAPDIFLKALELLGVKKEEAVVLEDSKNGILASYAAGIPVICIPDLVKHSQDIIDKTYLVLDDLNQVIKEIERL